MRDLTENERQALAAPDGVLVLSVAEGPGQVANLETGDVITTFCFTVDRHGYRLWPNGRDTSRRDGVAR